MEFMWKQCFPVNGRRDFSMNKKMIVASDSGGGIGYQGQLLFYLSEDMRRFRELTTGHIVVMGRKTAESLPEGKPLSERINILLTKQPDYKRKGFIVCHSKDEAEKRLQKLVAKTGSDVFIIGGEEIYRLYLKEVDTIYLTKVYTKRTVDTWFPDFKQTGEWEVVGQSSIYRENDVEFSFFTYVKKRN